MSTNKKLKQLYLGKKIEDLQKHYELPEEIYKKPLRSLLLSLNKLHEQAKFNQISGDQELSYVYYMRYFSIVNGIKKRADYTREKRYISEMIGVQSKIAMNDCEELAQSLILRYGGQQKETNEFKLKCSSADACSNDDSIVQYNFSGYLNGGGGCSNNELSIKNESNNIEFDLNGGQQSNLPDYSVLSCQELFEMIRNTAQSLLIMDCRPRKDYNESQIMYEPCLNIPEEILTNGQSAGTIQSKLDHKSIWASRSIKDHIVLMDWNCNGIPKMHQPIYILRDILTNWDPDVTYRSPIKILQGGYEEFLLRYPAFVTNATVKNPASIRIDDTLDEIEYPSLTDIAMKDDVRGFKDSLLSSKRPLIDRSSKKVAVKWYDDKKSKMVEIMNECADNYDKGFENEKKLKEAQTELNELKNVENKIFMDEEKINIHAREQEVIYRILQLENSEKDYKHENERLQQKLKEAELREKLLNEKISESETEKLKLAEDRLEKQKQIQKQIDEQHERDKLKREQEKLERQRTLEAVRESKRHIPLSIDEDEATQPKIPQFDRSVKPTVEINNIANIQRDFSPVHGQTKLGLTGLQNLGNTCYMNSILQCISNTSSLTQYFYSNTYKHHINYKNKTKGRIAEELAALIQTLWAGTYKAVACRNLRYVIGQFQQMFSGIEQQDSHEFLTILMDLLHLDLQTLKVPQLADNNNLSEKAWLDFTKGTESYILRTFYGQIKSTVKCIICKKESATYDCFSNLSLELPNNANQCYLEDCLELYFNGEKIQGWNCPDCKTKRTAIKKLDISKLPPVLVIHLKRFYAEDGTTYRKKTNYVYFPLKELNLTEHLTKSESRLSTSKSYNLYAVSNHYGSMESGHYTAFCKNNNYNKWFKFDDQVVSSIEKSEIVSSAGYILFYANIHFSSLVYNG